ncbi:MAG: response regulator [Eubacteriales bacterium]|nr:response regulator [Eubacteriales bacterium]
MSMTILAVDDEPVALDVLCRAIRETEPDCALFDFADPWKALGAVESGGVIPDVAFLDVEMFDLTGLELAKRLKDVCARVNIVFVTGYAEYMGEAFRIHASGYILKPVQPQAIRMELDDLRRPVKRADDGRLRVQCFGNFEVFLGERPLEFSRSKTKELFAYLVNRRGAACTVRELAAALWEDRPDSAALQSHLRQLVKDLTDTLAAVGASKVLCKQRGRMAVRPEAFSCDYYDFIQGDVQVVNAYMGEYMAQYSWAEFVVAYLDQR